MILRKGDRPVAGPKRGALDGGRAVILPGLLFLAIFIGLFGDFFLTDRLFYSRDMAGLEIPMRGHVVGLMKAGRIPLWTEAFGNGQPVLANPKFAVFYPSTWLYLVFPFSVAFKFHFLFHAIVAWLGLYVLARAFGLSGPAGFLGATSFLLGGFYLSSVEFYNHVAAFCWIPWLLLALRSRTPRAPRTLLALVAAWALILLAGAPHFIPLALLWSFLSVIILGDRKKQRLLVALGTFVAALGLTAVQIVPAFDLLKGKAREPAETLRWSLEPIQLANLAFPDFLGADRGTAGSEYWGGHLFDKGYPLYYSLYASPGLLLLALLGLRRPRDKVRTFLVVSAFAFLLLSALRLFPFFALLSKLPGIGLIRYPVNYLGVSIVCLSFLAAFGLDAWRAPSRPQAALLSLVLGLSLASLLVLASWPGVFLKPLGRLFVIDDPRLLSLLSSSLRRGFVAAAAFSGVLLLAQATRKIRVPLLYGVIGLLIADLFVANRGINPTVSPAFYDPPPFLSAGERPVRICRDPALPDGLGDKAVRGLRLQSFLRDSLNPYTAVGSVQYVYDRDFFTLYPDDLALVIKKLRQADPATRRKMLADSGCDYSVSSRPLIASGSPPRLIEGLPVYFEPVPERRRGPYLAKGLVRVDSLEQALALFGRPDFAVGSSAIVYEQTGLETDPYQAGTMRIAVAEERPGTLVCATDAPRASLAVFPIRHDPRWTASVDGRRTAVIRANLISSALIVPKGHHRIVLEYAPASFKIGAAISLLSVFGLAACAFIRRRLGMAGVRRG